jgi:glutathione S-transferase
MPVVLHRFALSHHCEKVRVGLDYKAVDYTVVDHLAGPGQLAVYRLSGQRQLPVLEHDGVIVADSTEILLYLERAFPQRRPLLPRQEPRRREALDLESRLDDVLGRWVPRIFARHAADDPRLVDLAIAHNLGFGGLGLRVARGAVGAMRAVLRHDRVRGILDETEARVCTLLAELCDRLSTSPYLVGDAPTLADLAAVGLAHHLRFPRSKHLPDPTLAGVEVAAIARDPKLARFFEWRDDFYRDYSN